MSSSRPSTRAGRIAAVGAVTVLSVLATLGIAAPASAAPAGPSPAHSGPAGDGRLWADRARDADRALQSRLSLGDAGHGLYVESYPVQQGDPSFSYLWTFREAMEATQDIAAIPGAGPADRRAVDARFASLQSYAGSDAFGLPGYESAVAPPLGTGGDVFYDDNAIVGLSYVARYQRTHRATDLRSAVTQLQTVLRGWDTDPAAPCPGGENWIATPGNTVRGANITGLGAQLAAHLFELTRQRAYLDDATRLWNWNETCLKESDGLYRNSIGDDGTVDPTLWTYNSGAMIGTAAVLSRATHDGVWLQRARTAASASLDYWTADDRLYSQPAIFNEMYFDDLLLLGSMAPDPRYRATVTAYADRIWSSNRDAATGLFHFGASGGGAADPAVRVSTLEQAAAVQIFASLAWTPRDLRLIA